MRERQQKILRKNQEILLSEEIKKQVEIAMAAALAQKKLSTHGNEQSMDERKGSDFGGQQQEERLKIRSTGNIKPRSKRNSIFAMVEEISVRISEELAQEKKDSQINNEENKRSIKASTDELRAPSTNRFEKIGKIKESSLVRTDEMTENNFSSEKQEEYPQSKRINTVTTRPGGTNHHYD